MKSIKKIIKDCKFEYIFDIKHGTATFFIYYFESLNESIKKRISYIIKKEFIIKKGLCIYKNNIEDWLFFKDSEDSNIIRKRIERYLELYV